jgi:hypothetical protein
MGEEVKIGCVYLAREAEGLLPMREFLDSYRRHDSGIEHTLIVIYKGEDGPQREAAQSVFSEVSHLPYFMPDEGFDIGGYLRVAQLFEFEYFLFLNTFSQIQAEYWLKKMHAVASQPNVGLCAATASYESLSHTYRYIENVCDTFRYRPREFDSAAFAYVEILLRQHAQHLLNRDPYQVFVDRLQGIAQALASGQRVAQKFASEGSRYWTTALGAFPNAHLRSNAFMVRRDALNGLAFAIPATKEHSNAFESGPNGISARLLRAGLQLVVAGADGEAYAIENWAKSGTYRSLDQGNLLVSDNQTRSYQTLNRKEKITYQFLTWGERSVEPLPVDFPTFGIDPTINFY